MYGAKTGAEQQMYRYGQIREEMNPLWSLDFKSYHGLHSVHDIPLFTLEHIACQRLSADEIKYCNALMKRLSPLIRNPMPFYLISMIMLLDTSSVEKDYDAYLVGKDHVLNDVPTYRQLDQHDKFLPDGTTESFHSCIPPLSEVFLGNDEIVYSVASSSTEPTIPRLTCSQNFNEKNITQDRFREIKALQNHFMHLLWNHCKYSKNDGERNLGYTDAALKTSMIDLKKIIKTLSGYFSTFIK